ncbi:hypothetical protein ACWKWU_13435 [Chitinophaga lutea]
MKWRLTPIGIITVFAVFVMAQGSATFSGQAAPAVTSHGTVWHASDTVPDNPQDSTKKKRKKDKDRDTSNMPRKDTFLLRP